MDDWERLGQARVVGPSARMRGADHGRLFRRPGHKDVPALARLGFPIGEVDEEGDVVITKVAQAGGLVTEATCKEQLLYEIHDPPRICTPDVVADFSQVRVREIARGPRRARRRPRASEDRQAQDVVAYVDGCIGEGQISYAGPGAVARGELALAIVRERLALIGVEALEARYELIGVNALHGERLGRAHLAEHGEPYEVRARVVVRTKSMAEAALIGNEVEALLTCGPGGGGGATKSAREVIGIVSALVPESLVTPALTFFEV